MLFGTYDEKPYSSGRAQFPTWHSVEDLSTEFSDVSVLECKESWIEGEIKVGYGKVTFFFGLDIKCAFDEEVVPADGFHF